MDPMVEGVAADTRAVAAIAEDIMVVITASRITAADMVVLKATTIRP